MPPKPTALQDTLGTLRAGNQAALMTALQRELAVEARGRLGTRQGNENLWGQPSFFTQYGPGASQDELKEAANMVAFGAMTAPVGGSSLVNTLQKADARKLLGIADDVPYSAPQVQEAVTTDISKRAPDLWELNKISTLEKLRGRGFADKKLQGILAQADAAGAKIALTPSNAFGASKTKLEKWYKDNGFRKNRGVNKDFATRESMIRHPIRTQAAKDAIRAEGNATRFGDPSEYRGVHTAPTRAEANTLDNLAGVYPDDIYNPAVAGRFYGHGGPSQAMDNETAHILSKFRGQPDATVDVFRAVPKGVETIQPNDWVTINKNYAASHGKANLGEDFHIISKRVKASDVTSQGDSIHEFGYSPAPQQQGSKILKTMGTGGAGGGLADTLENKPKP